jgi:hypothetical protein
MRPPELRPGQAWRTMKGCPDPAVGCISLVQVGACDRSGPGARRRPHLSFRRHRSAQPRRDQRPARRGHHRVALPCRYGDRLAGLTSGSPPRPSAGARRTTCLALRSGDRHGVARADPRRHSPFVHRRGHPRPGRVAVGLAGGGRAHDSPARMSPPAVRPANQPPGCPDPGPVGPRARRRCTTRNRHRPWTDRAPQHGVGEHFLPARDNDKVCGPVGHGKRGRVHLRRLRQHHVVPPTARTELAASARARSPHRYWPVATASMERPGSVPSLPVTSVRM